MKNLKRNLLLIFIANAILLAGFLAVTIQKFTLNPQLTFGVIVLLVVDFVLLSTFTSLLTIGIQFIIRKVRQNKNKE
ncbi:hypothetical protein ACWCL1_07985 [Ligilactobacillus sp. LYQ135]